ncbi:Transcription factor SOX-21 [Psilocybe cubensis]|uniref:Transcription factor SOX-21 n=2 Tax=Psilocybe cubensis TaxID=181762 RepID=A0ACB8GRX6_PSICU|nr:Transcription factor SOX-21 [Psilocybe cubensis]KAH9478177.1 Transcription factor SOX-21 [Psilocybe cubensis]
MPALRTRETQSRTLDVTADAPQPPSFNIVSPTPRAFTFPVTNNLSDSPYSSRSNSPLEPSDLRSFPSQCTLPSSSSSFTPPPTYTSTESPSSSPLAVDLQRRKSSSSDSPERRPKKGEEDYIKRPENAFILFRRKCCEDRQAAQDEEAASKGPAKKQRQADLSKTISQQWKSLSPEERKEWENLAKNKKLEHEKRYPNYVYRPQRAKDKDGRPKNGKKLKKLDYDESASMSFIVPVPRPHGRSASAPSQPAFQSIQIPNVYNMAPCPTSPSLLPMISRRSAFPGHPEDSASSFDFIPNTNNSFVPPSYSIPAQFEAALQSSEFLRSMFGTSDQQQSSSGSPLQQLTMQGSTTEAPGLLPAHQIVSPSSSVGSGSSGPSSPLSGPFTPNSSNLTQNFSHLTPDASLEAQAQAEIDLQLEMQMQQEFAAFTWEGNHNSIWSNEPVILMGDDFDINAIRPVELDLSLPKYTESVAIAPPQVSGLDFGHDFSPSLDAVHYPDESRNLGILNFDEMMAGHSF